MQAHSRPPVIQFALLLVLAVLGNATPLALFFGVDLIFGSIATLMILALYGTTWGVATALVAGLYTWILWHHPWACVVLVGEALVVGLLLRRLKGNFIVAMALYWAFIGVPLILLFYSTFQGMDFTVAWLAALKQALNGIINALVVGLVFSLTGFARRSRIPIEEMGSLFHRAFNLAVAFALVPSMIVIVHHARQSVGRIERDMTARLDAVADLINVEATKWFAQQQASVHSMAEVAARSGLRDLPTIKTVLRAIRRGNPELLTLYIARRDGQAIAFDPDTTAAGRSTVGLNFADRPYFQKVLESKEPVLSDVFQGRGGTDEPIFTVNEPILQNGRVIGVASAAVNLRAMQTLLAVSGFVATLVDGENEVVGSSRPDLSPLDPWRAQPGFRIETSESGYYRQYPKDPASAMTQWRDTHLGKSLSITGAPGWRLMVEVPLGGQLLDLQSQYLWSMAFLVVLTLLVVLTVYLVSRWLAQPLSDLARETNNLPRRLEDSRPVHWPKSSLPEVNFLISNFQTVTEALRRRFAEIETSARDLGSANRRLQAEIAERQRIEAELRKTNRMKDEFLTTLSHELRTPLNAILGFTEVIRGEGLSPDSAGYFDIISRNASHLNTLIGDLLDVSRIITGKFVLQKSAVSLKEVVTSALESIRLAADAKGVSLRWRSSDPDLVVFGDPARLQQVLWNLLSNSVKFTPSGGEIEVLLERRSESVEIRVRDTGEGIAPEFIPQMFSRFLQEDRSLSRVHGGLGIGLSIVRQIIEMHGGHVRAESLGKGKGATMIVTLPLRHEEKRPEEKRPEAQI